MGKVIIFSAPSGSGKTTIVRELLKRFPQFEFSVSATSRAPRGCERHGCDYHFMTHEEFMQAVAEKADCTRPKRSASLAAALLQAPVMM